MCSISIIVVFCITVLNNVEISMIKAENVTAIPADSFVESIGVNTHWSSPNVYTLNYTGLRAKLAESGIRYVRDHIRPTVYGRVNDLYENFGIKTIMLSGRYRNGSEPHILDPKQVDEELYEVKTHVLAATVALEGPNEYDIEHGPDPNWAENLRNYSIALYTKAKADEKLQHLPVVGPSLVSLHSYETVGDLDQYIDYVNVHIYLGVTWPDFKGWDANGSSSITWFLNYLARCQSPLGKRVQATETGYHNYIPHIGVSEEADGKYTARSFVEFFRRGIYFTYKYELVNQNIQGQEGNFGLLRADLSEKPSFRAVKNLIAILSDKGPSFNPGTLSYVLNGNLTDVRQILFQKRNGDFYLIVWMEVPSFDIKTRIDLYPLPEQLILTLQDTNKISSATLYAFNNTADVNVINLPIDNNRITFNATDKINIIKLSSENTYIFNGLH